MLPAREGFHAVEPWPDCWMILDDVKAELLGRVIKIADHRNVGDGWSVTQQISVGCQPFVDNGEAGVDASFQKCDHRRIAGTLGGAGYKTARPKIAVELLSVESDPAQRFQPLVLALLFELAGEIREVSKKHARLGELLLS